MAKLIEIKDIAEYQELVNFLFENIMPNILTKDQRKNFRNKASKFI
jgi:hypothetical protein